MNDELEAKRAEYDAALRRYRDLRRRGAKHVEEWAAAAAADRARLDYYRVRDALEISPMTDPLVQPETPEQFTVAIRRAPRTRGSLLSIAFNVAMPFLLFLGVAIPLVIYAIASAR
jgi:hypothetical protein